MKNKCLKKIFICLSILILLIGFVIIGYKWRRSYLIERANDVFDPIERKITGGYWFLSGPHLIGNFDDKTATKFRNRFGSSNIKKENMELTIHASDGTYFVYFK